MPFGPEAFVAATSVVAAAATWRTAVDSRNYLRAQKEKRSELGALHPTQFQRVAEVGKSLVAGPGYVAGPHRPGVNPHVPLGGFREAQRRAKTGTFRPQPKRK